MFEQKATQTATTIADNLFAKTDSRYGLLLKQLTDIFVLGATVEYLERIKNDEINYQIGCFFDSGYTVKLGDEANGFTKTSPLCDTLTECAEWLSEQLQDSDT